MASWKPLGFHLVNIFRGELAALTVIQFSFFFVQQTGDPEKRLRGGFGYLGLFTMLGLSIEVAGKLIASG